ncbi:MAG: sterol desaturase family protein [Proteobacteria bacterium]|nr:sterol desaturase family protein [Pseudomonadota bacterium]
MTWLSLEDLLTLARRQTVEMLIFGVTFALIGLLLRRFPGRAKLSETRINVVIYVLDLLFVAPLILAAIIALDPILSRAPLAFIWSAAGHGGTALAVLVIGDLIGYWRHRLQHSPALWPAHAIHHSDRELSWFSLNRMHPVDRLGTALDTVLLAALGFPAWALGLNGLARHYYGYLIHADVPWTFGKLDLILNSPAMHRWHHSRDVHGKNFATLFSLWDRLFGTYFAPGPCEGALGVDADMGKGALGQYLYPFHAWAGSLRRLAVGARTRQ